MLDRRKFMAFCSLLLFPKFLKAAGAKRAEAPGIFKIRGKVLVNKREAKKGQLIKNGDVLETFDSSIVIFIVDGCVYKLRPNSKLEFKKRKKENTTHILSLIRGAILSVYEKEVQKTLKTKSVSIGIRGSAAYLESMPQSDYFCLCYGQAEIRDRNNQILKEIKTKHHDKPLIITKDGSKTLVKDHKMMNHSDHELVELENLVGRQPPFDPNQGYNK